MDAVQIQEVKEWWGRNVNARPVWRVEELPERSYKKILVDELQFGYEVRRDILVLGKPGSEVTELIHAHYWEIVSAVLNSYQPYAIGGLAAMKFYMGERSTPKELQVATKNSNIRIELPGDFSIAAEGNANFFALSNIGKWCQEITTDKGYKLTLETPESLLLRIRPRMIKDFPDTFSSFLKGIDFKQDSLKEMLRQESKPVVYMRLAAYFEKFGKDKEAELIRRMVKSSTEYNKPGVSAVKMYAIPTSLVTTRILSDAPNVTRFREQLRYYAEEISKEDFVKNTARHSLKKILQNAQATKKYDTYHSSTIEGYRVSEAEIQALIDGKAKAGTTGTPEEIETRMALKGYLEAHTFVLKKIEEGHDKNPPLSQALIKEIFAHLFLPTVEAGLLDKNTLTTYRNHPIYIRNSRYVPPNEATVTALMEALVEEVNAVQDPVTKALLAHYGFVTVHPYKDGNGRVGRFLMNYLLCVYGYHWVTIRVEDRDPYFKSLEAAQVDNAVERFSQFMKKYFESQRGILSA